MSAKDFANKHFICGFGKEKPVSFIYTGKTPGKPTVYLMSKK